MTVSYVTQASAAAATVALPAYNSGDIAYVFAFRDGSTMAPTDDANYTTLASSGANTCSAKVAARKLTSGDPNPSFTNATEIVVVILRASAGEFAPTLANIFNTFAAGGASSNQISYTGVTVKTSGGLIVGVAGHRSATDMNVPSVTGMTTRAPTTNTLAVHTAAPSAVSYSFTTRNFGATVNASSGWRSYAVEVLGNTTQMFPTSANEVGRGKNEANLSGGTGNGWTPLALSTSRGSGVTSENTSTVNGPTNGVESTLVGAQHEWISPPLAADTTIAGPIESNWRMSRSAAGNNMGPQTVVERIDNTGTIQETVLNTEQGVENSSTETAQNWTAVPTSTAFNKGDRIRVRVAYNDAGGTAASGGTETFFYNGTAAASSGDSWVRFGDVLTFASEPAGTTIYPTDTASDINPGSAAELEAWTSRGAGAVTLHTSTGTGFTAPVQVTDSAGGTAREWYTKPLTAFTLGGSVRVNLRAGSAGSNFSGRCEIAVCDADGTNPVVWAAINTWDLNGAEAARSFLVSGDDTSVADGQRLRIRFYIDDGLSALIGAGPTYEVYYAGASGATGDTFLTFSNTLTAYTHSAVTNGAAYESAVLADSPVAYWRLNEAAAPWVDNVGHKTAWVGASTVSPSAGSALPSDGDAAVTLGGANGHLMTLISSDFNFGASGPLSVEAWVKRTRTGTEEAIWCQGNASLYLLFWTDDHIQLAKQGTGQIVASSTTITDTNWHHLVATWNGGTTGKMYVDGVDVTSGATSRTLAYFTYEVAYRIGARVVTQAGDQPLAGSIDELALYNTELSAARVAAHYAAAFRAVKPRRVLQAVARGGY